MRQTCTCVSRVTAMYLGIDSDQLKLRKSAVRALLTFHPERTGSFEQGSES